MANVGFKLGEQSALKTIHDNKQAIEGTFYLTSDSHRLYIGLNGGTVAPVNEGVITVNTTKDLPSVTDHDLTAGSFYYAKEDNILCVYNGSKWVQINSVVTNKTVANSVSVVGGEATISTSVTDSLDTTKTGTFSIKGDKGIVVTADGTAITISGTPLSLGTDAGEEANSAIIKHVDADGNSAGSAKIIGGANVTVVGTADGITISSTDTNTKNASMAVANNETSGFDISVTDSDNTTKSATLDPVIKIGATESEVKFVNGVADLDVYTIGEVNAIKTGLENKIAQDLKAFNAMEYKGTVGTSDATVGINLPTANVKNGQAYLVTGNDFTYDGTSYPAGTLVVAQGDESTDGFIPAADISWAFVTGSTSDTTYSGVAVEGGMTLIRSTDQSSVMNFTVAAGNIGTDGGSEIGIGSDIKIKSSATSGNTQALTIAHKTYSNSVTGTADSTQPDAMVAKASSYQIPVISGIEVSNGHVTGFKTQTYTVTDTNATLTAVGATVADAGKGVSVGQSVTLTDSANGATTKNANFSVESDSLEVKANDAGSGMTVNMVWGTF